MKDLYHLMQLKSCSMPLNRWQSKVVSHSRDVPLGIVCLSLTALAHTVKSNYSCSWIRGFISSQDKSLTVVLILVCLTSL